MSTKPAPKDTLLDTAAVAALVGNQPRTVMRWRTQPGEGPPFVRVNRKTVRYRQSDVDAFIAARVVSQKANT
jgi:predicted DNA-binding transcriptional regulator AlpA